MTDHAERVAREIAQAHHDADHILDGDIDGCCWCKPLMGRIAARLRPLLKACEAFGADDGHALHDMGIALHGFAIVVDAPGAENMHKLTVANLVMCLAVGDKLNALRTAYAALTSPPGADAPQPKETP